MLVYHGSSNNFEKFDYSRIGTNGTTEGFGFYFTDKKHIAENYTNDNGYLYSVQLKGKELSGDELTITENQFRKLAVHLNDKNEYLSNFGDVNYEGLNAVLNEAVSCEYDNSNDDADLIGGVVNAYGNSQDVLQALYSMFGYGYIKDTDCAWGNSNGNQTVYVALVNEVIEIISVENKIEKVGN